MHKMLPCDHDKQTGILNADNKGYTLIELIAVVVLLGIISSFFISRFSFNNSWAVDSSLRNFRSQIEFVIQESLSKQTTYQLHLNLSEGSYRFWEIEPLDINESMDVDLLSGLRSSKEQSRQFENNMSIEETISRRELKDAQPLDGLFYQAIFNDPNGPQRRVPSIDYPTLSEKTLLPPEVEIISVNRNDNEQGFNSNYEIINFRPSLGNNKIIINFRTEKGPAKIFIYPLENLVTLRYEYQ